MSGWWSSLVAAIVIALALLLSGCGAFLPPEPMSYGDCLWRESKGIRCSPAASMERGKGSVPATVDHAASASATSTDKAQSSEWPLHRLRALHAMAAGGPLVLHRAGLALDKPGFFAAGAQAEFPEGGFLESGRRKWSVQPETVVPYLHPVFEKNPASEARQLLVVKGAPECGDVVNASALSTSPYGGLPCPHSLRCYLSENLT